MRTILFIGPTLPANVAREKLPNVEIRPPAACGDIYRATLERPSIIGLVDGYFEHRLSVWHKEITWALHRGIHVYGAASMGALRAAELEPFGMVGVGWVFEQFISLRLEDDDEVAVAHEPADRDYRIQSDAMVNLRVTLQRAVELGVIAASSRDRLIERLKAQFYPQRSRRALGGLSRELLGADEFDRFISWLDEFGIINQKHLDACEMLDRIIQDIAAGRLNRDLPSNQPFCHTNAWQALVERVTRDLSARAETNAGGSSVSIDGGEAMDATSRTCESELSSILMALQERFAERYWGLLAEALERALAVAIAHARGKRVESGAAQVESERFRRERGLLGASDTARWLSDARLDLLGFSSLINDSVLVRQLAPDVRQALLQQLLDVIRIHGLTSELWQHRDSSARPS